MRMMMAAAALVAAAPVAAQEDPRAAIMAAMDASAAGWNAGDLDRFMSVYAADAMYVTSKGLLKTKAAIADRYRPSFASGGNARGSLSFQPQAWRTISNVHQLLIARWTLTPGGGKAPESGMTTLLFERRGEGWRIISDHSS